MFTARRTAVGRVHRVDAHQLLQRGGDFAVAQERGIGWELG